MRIGAGSGGEGAPGEGGWGWSKRCWVGPRGRGEYYGEHGPCRVSVWEWAAGRGVSGRASQI